MENVWQSHLWQVFNFLLSHITFFSYSFRPVKNLFSIQFVLLSALENPFWKANSAKVFFMCATEYEHTREWRSTHTSSQWCKSQSHGKSGETNVAYTHSIKFSFFRSSYNYFATLYKRTLPAYGSHFSVVLLFTAFGEFSDSFFHSFLLILRRRRRCMSADMKRAARYTDLFCYQFYAQIYRQSDKNILMLTLFHRLQFCL
jgi:hypothetical protein